MVQAENEKRDLGQILASRIAAERKRSGFTQAGLAEKLGYSDKSISKWERGDGIPDVFCLKRMADLFGVTVDALLTEESETVPAARPATSCSPTAPAEEVHAETAPDTEEKIVFAMDPPSVVNHWGDRRGDVCGDLARGCALFPDRDILSGGSVRDPGGGVARIAARDADLQQSLGQARPDVLVLLGLHHRAALPPLLDPARLRHLEADVALHPRRCHRLVQLPHPSGMIP